MVAKKTADDSANSLKAPNVNMPVMVIVGLKEERLRALRSGGKPQLPAPEPEQDVNDVEAAPAAPEIEPPAPAKDARRLTAADFGGTNLTEAKTPKGPRW